MSTGPATETVSSDEIRRLRRSRGIDAAIAKLAERQHGVVARRQLVELGLGERGVDHRIASGRLHHVVPGVYAVGHGRVALMGRWMAATLAGATGAVLSHRSAAALWGIRDTSSGPVHITIPHKSSSSRLVHRHCSRLLADETTVEEGIPVTTVPKTILDLAATASIDVVEKMIREAEYRRLYDSLSLLDLTNRYPARRGSHRVRTALARIETTPSGRSRSPLEDRFLPFLRRHRLPLPRLNDWIVVGGRRFQVDCHWPGTGQTVELDSWQAHGTRAAFREDRTRDRLLRVAGYEVTRISWAQLDDEPDAVASDLHCILASLQ